MWHLPGGEAVPMARETAWYLQVFLFAVNLEQQAKQNANCDAGENPADDTHFQTPAIALM